MTEAARLTDLLEAARYQGHFSFRAKLTSSDPMQGELVGVALAHSAGTRGLCAAGAPRGRRTRSRRRHDRANPHARRRLDLLKPILEDESVLKIVQNAKFDMVALSRYGIALTAIDDPCLMSYALDAGRAEHLPAELAGRLLSYTCLTEKEIMGTGRNAVALDRVEMARATEYAGEETDIGLQALDDPRSRGSRPNP